MINTLWLIFNFVLLLSGMSRCMPWKKVWNFDKIVDIQRDP